MISDPITGVKSQHIHSPTCTQRKGPWGCVHQRIEFCKAILEICLGRRRIEGLENADLINWWYLMAQLLFVIHLLHPEYPTKHLNTPSCWSLEQPYGAGPVINPILQMRTLGFRGFNDFPRWGYYKSTRVQITAILYQSSPVLYSLIEDHYYKY